MLLALLIAAGPPAHLVVPDGIQKERAAEAAPPSAILGDPALSNALGPPDAHPGAWVDYAIRTKGEPDVRVRFSILPPALPGGQYWLEEAGVSSAGQGSAVKLRAHGDPADPRNIDRMYIYVPGQAPIEIPLDQLPPPPAPAAKKPAKLVKGRPERVQVKGGVFEKAETMRVGDVRIWRSPKVPIWGLVKAVGPHQTVELLGSGTTGAHTIFPPGFSEDQLPQGKGSESTK